MFAPMKSSLNFDISIWLSVQWILKFSTVEEHRIKTDNFNLGAQTAKNEYLTLGV